MNNQCADVLSYIKQHGSISGKEAVDDLGVMRLASRIADLKHMGYDIRSEMESGVNRYGDTIHYKRYWVKE